MSSDFAADVHVLTIVGLEYRRPQPSRSCRVHFGNALAFPLL